GIATGWADGARIGSGAYSHIDQNQHVVDITTPYDAELNKLSIQLNGTFHFYGTATVRDRLSQNQAAQDSNAAGLGASVAAERAATKATKAYSFEADLVDLYARDPKAIDNLEDKALPATLQNKSVSERKKFLEQSVAERKAIQSKISEL